MPDLTEDDMENDITQDEQKPARPVLPDLTEEDRKSITLWDEGDENRPWGLFRPVMMDNVTKGLKNALDEQRTTYKYDEELHTFFLYFGLKKSKLDGVKIVIHIVSTLEEYLDVEIPDMCSHVVSYGLIDFKVDEDKRDDVSEFLHRVNCILPSGCFILDFDTGEICFKLVMNCQENIIWDHLMAWKESFMELWISPAYMFERYGDGIIAVCENTMTPQEAFESTFKRR